MKKIVKLFSILGIIFITGCTNTQTQEPPREKTTAEKVAYVADFILVNAVYNGYNVGLTEEFVKSKSNSKSDSVTTTSVDSNGVTNTHTTTKTTTKTKSRGVGFGIGY